MENRRRIRVTCPECEILYRLPDETLLPIARCGRCYGAVVPESAFAEELIPVLEPKAAA